MTIVRTNLPTEVLNPLIDCHDQVIMLGHGSPQGLFGDRGGMIVNESNVESLRRKTDSIFIWCHASTFVKQHNLKGFATGMFISEDIEARFCLPLDQYTMFLDADAVDEQNALFVDCVRDAIEKPVEALYERVMGRKV